MKLMNRNKMIADLKNKLKMSDKEIREITGDSLLGLEDFYSQMKTSGAFEKPIKKKSTGGDLKVKGLAAPSIALQKMTEIEQLREEAKKLMSEKPTKKKAMGGDLKTEYRGGGAVNLGNYKGQF